MPKYDKKDFIETPSGNKVSKRSLLAGIKHIKVSGKSIIMSGAVIRGDLAVVSIGRYTIIQQNAVIRPPYKRFKQGLAFFPLAIGDHVMIEEEAIVNAASIGSHVHIGRGAVIGARTIIHPCSKIEAGAIVPADSVIAPFSIWQGFPARPKSIVDCGDLLLEEKEDIEEIPKELEFNKDFSSTYDDSIIADTELPECWMELQQELTEQFYANFTPL